MKYILILALLLAISCSNKNKSERISKTTENQENLIAILDTIWKTEQRPITLRDSLMKIHGADSELVKEQQAIYQKNHMVNERKVKHLLDTYGWPTKEKAGERGNWTICNVLCTA